MTLRPTIAWAVGVSLLAHLAVLGGLPGFAPTRPLAAPQPPRPLHAVLRPAPTEPSPPSTASPPTPPAPASRPTARTAPAVPTARPPVAETPTPAPTPATSPTPTPVPADAAPAAPPPPIATLDLSLPPHTARGARAGVGPLDRGGNGGRHAPAGPVRPEASAAEQAAEQVRSAPLAPASPTVTGTVTVREQRGATLSQAEVRTPWGRYCMRKRQSSRMTELHDSPFGQGMQATNCDRD